MSRTGIPLRIIWGVIDDGGIKFILNDTLSKHAIGDIVYKPVNKTGEHEYLLPLDGQALDTTKYKRLIDFLGFSTLPNLNGRYLRADSNVNQMIEAGLPNITGTVGSNAWSANDNELDYSLHTGAFSMEKAVLNGEHSNISWSQDNGVRRTKAVFDASKSNRIYGSSGTVTPLTYTVRAYICYA